MIYFLKEFPIQVLSSCCWWETEIRLTNPTLNKLRNYVNRKNFPFAYHTLIYSNFIYNINVWGRGTASSSSRLNMCLNKNMWAICHIYRRTSVAPLCICLGLFDLRHNYKYAIGKWVYKIHNMLINLIQLPIEMSFKTLERQNIVTWKYLKPWQLTQSRVYWSLNKLFTMVFLLKCVCASLKTQ